MNKVRVLIADNSPFIRQLLISFLKDNPDILVVGEARTGQEVLTMIEKTKPDVLTMDFNLPIMNGLETLRYIMKHKPLPVIMISSFTQGETDITLEALEIGACDFITKPDSTNYTQLIHLKDEVIEKIIAATKQCSLPVSQTLANQQKVALGNWKPFNNDLKLIIIGTSSGGPRALKEILPLFPASLEAALIIVQHMPKGFTASLAQRLDKESQITVREAQEGDILKPGLALLAPGDFHLLVENNQQISLNKKPPLWGVRPAVDHTLKSAAPFFKENLLGVILTGMGKDGTEGLLTVKEYGGRTIVESEETSTIFGMPRSAIQAGAADIILPLGQIPAFITKILREGLHG